MPGDAARGQLDGARNLLERLHRRELDLAARARHAAAFREAVLGVDFREVLVGHELDADARRTLFAGLGQEDDVAIERHVLPLEHQHDHQAGDDVVLVVHGAAAVDVAAVARGAEGRIRPLLRVDVDDVGVPHDEEGPLLAVALEAGDDVRTLGLEGQDLGRDALRLEHLLQIVGRRLLVAGRVGRVHAHERLKVAERFFVELRRVGWLRCLSGRSDDREGDHEQAVAHRGRS